MRKLTRESINALITRPRLAPLLLLWLAAAGYFLTIQYFGYYWDDWAFAWISQTLGSEGLAQYFSTNRPYWGMIYELTTPILKEVPWRWQVFALFWRWMGALALWLTLRQVWKDRPQAALWVSALFVVYPGFGQQPIAILYGHFFIVLAAYLFSLYFMLLALRQPRRALLYHAAALLCSLINLVTMEYFFLLDLLRPLLLWAALSDQQLPLRRRVWAVLRSWLPYLLLFLGVGIWRAFFFSYQTQNYNMNVLSDLSASFFPALGELIVKVAGDIWRVTVEAWLRVFQLPAVSDLGRRSTLVYFLLAASTFAAAGILLWGAKAGSQNERDRRWGWQCMGIGAAGLLVAGGPFWAIGLPIGLTFPSDRFTLPFMLGVAFLLAGLLQVVPLWRVAKVALLGLMLGLAIGQHFEVATAFRRDWNMQRSLFWQMSWRMPGLEPGTTLLFNDWETRYYSDNSLTAPLNWLYAPQNSTPEMQYMLYYPEVRLGLGLMAMEPGIPIEQNYLAATFSGSTSQTVALHYSSSSCLRVLDADLDVVNWMVPPLMQEAAAFANPGLILPLEEPQAVHPMESIFGKEPPPSWCYYFAKAELARQLGDWDQVAALGDQAFALGDHPNDPSERLVYVEGYAHQGSWERAIQLSWESEQVNVFMRPVLCELWKRIDHTVSVDVPGKETAIEEMRTGLECGDW